MKHELFAVIDLVFNYTTKFDRTDFLFFGRISSKSHVVFLADYSFKHYCSPFTKLSNR